MDTDNVVVDRSIFWSAKRIYNARASWSRAHLSNLALMYFLINMFYPLRVACIYHYFCFCRCHASLMFVPVSNDCGHRHLSVSFHPGNRWSIYPSIHVSSLMWPQEILWLKTWSFLLLRFLPSIESMTCHVLIQHILLTVASWHCGCPCRSSLWKMFAEPMSSLKEYKKQFYQ